MGVMLGDSDYLLAGHLGWRVRSADGGATWSDDQLNPLFSIGWLRFFTPEVGWLYSMINAGEELATSYARSSDGGRSWTPVRPPNTRFFYVVPTSADVAYAYHGGLPRNDTLIMVTRDGGRNWALCLRDTVPRFAYSGSMTDRMNRGNDTVFVRSDSSMLRTTDGGRSWKWYRTIPSKLAAYEYVIGMDLRFQGNCWALTSGKVLRSTDDGATWDTVYTDPTARNAFVRLVVYDARRVAVLATDVFSPDCSGMLYRSSDAGVTWTSSCLHGLPPNVLDPALFDDGAGAGVWARSERQLPGGFRLHFCVTNDWWESFDEEFSMSSSASATSNLTFADRSTAWVAVYDRIYSTSTGGIDAVTPPPALAATWLAPSYPNPAAGSTVIPYAVDGAGERLVRIELYDALGRRVRTLFDGTAAAGEHRLRVETGGLKPGLFFVVLDAGGRRDVRKMVVAR
jgi:photosystem II stability/assembly factor-like uncharacterized protein